MEQRKLLLKFNYVVIFVAFLFISQKQALCSFFFKNKRLVEKDKEN